MPMQARALLSKVGGEVVHVHCEEDEGEVMGNGHTRAPAPRVSYRPYRETSAAMIKWVICVGHHLGAEGGEGFLVERRRE